MAITASQLMVKIGADTADAERGMRSVSEHLGNIGAGASHAGGLLQQMFSMAGGMALVESVKAAAGAVVDLGRQAFDAVASYERLSLSMESLVAREIKNASGVEQTIVVGQRRIQLTDKERAKLDDLRAAQERYAAQLAVDREHLEEAIKKGKESTAEIELRRVKLGQLEAKLQETSAAIATLQSKDGQLVDVTQKVVRGQLSMAEALAQAGPKAKELVSWIETLAIQSPFSQEGVADAFRTAMAYGFTADEAKRLTQANIDFAAATGQSSAVMNQVALALGQIKAKGKLAGQEVLQLTNAGVPVRDILARAFGVTTAELETMQEKGLIPANKAIEAITASLESDFGGAAKRQATSLAGLTESLSDLQKISLRSVFTGVFQAAQPYIAAVVDKLSDPAFQAALTAIGASLGGIVAQGLQQVSVWIAPLIPQAQALFGQVMAAAPGILASLSGGLTTLQSIWQSVWPTLQATFAAVWPLITDAIRLAGPIIQQIGVIVGQVVAQVSPLVRQVVTEAAALIRENLPTIQRIISEALTAIKIIWDAVWPYLEKVLRFVWENAKTVVQTAINLIKDIVHLVLSVLKGDWQGAWDSVKQIVSDVWEGIKGLVRNGINAVADLFGIKDWGALGRSIVEGIKHGIESAWKWLTDTVSNLAQSALDAAKRALGISSPSKLAAQMIGRPFVEGIAEGLRGAASLLPSVMPEIAAHLTAPLPAIAASAATQTINRNVYYTINANYRYQDERSLRDDLRLLQMLGAAT